MLECHDILAHDVLCMVSQQPLTPAQIRTIRDETAGHTLDKTYHSLWINAGEAMFVDLAVHVCPHDYLWEANEVFNAAEQNYRC